MSIAGCALITAVIKAAGPVVLGGRELPTWFTSVVILLAPALLAALVATQASRTATTGRSAPTRPGSRRAAWWPGGPGRSSPAWCSRPR